MVAPLPSVADLRYTTPAPLALWARAHMIHAVDGHAWRPAQRSKRAFVLFEQSHHQRPDITIFTVLSQ